MSVPYGAPQQQPGPAQQPAVGVNLTLILPLVAAGLGLIAYLLAFADDVSSFGTVEYLLAAAALAGLSVLPKALKLLPAAVVLSAVPTLLFLQGMIKSEADVKGMQIVVLIIALLETAAIVVSLLLDAGIVKFEPKPPAPYGGQPGGWNPQSGGFPQQGQPGQFGPPSGQFGALGQQQPQQPQQPQQQQQQQQQPGAPQPTSYMPQPGQFNQPGQGTPPGGFGGQQQG